MEKQCFVDPQDFKVLLEVRVQQVQQVLKV
jgi:hypothetical protein